jgi:hypothetical protein
VRTPAMNLIRQLLTKRDIAHVCVEKSGFKLELKGPSARAEV